MNHKLPYAIFQNLIEDKIYKLNDFQLSYSSTIILLTIFKARNSTNYLLSKIAFF